MTRVTDPPATALPSPSASDSPADASACPPPALSDQLRISVGRLSRRLKAERSADDLNELQYSVLAHLARTGPLSLTRIAADAHVTPTSITRVADHLIGLGLAARTRDDHDGRVFVLAPTRAGTDVVSDVHRQRSQWLSRALSQLTARERRVLEQASPLLLRLAEAGAAQAAEAGAALVDEGTRTPTATPTTGGERL